MVTLGRGADDGERWSAGILGYGRIGGEVYRGDDDVRDAIFCVEG